MSDTRLTELSNLFRDGEPLSARKLNKLVEALNALEVRKTQRANDAGDWLPCYSCDDWNEYSVLAVRDAIIDDAGITLIVDIPTSESQLLVANEGYALHAASMGWVKILNDVRPCMVSVKAGEDPVTFDALSIDQTSIALSGVQPAGMRLTAASAKNDEERVPVYATVLTTDEDATTTTSTTTTTTPDPNTNASNCSGDCEWTWDAANNWWVLTDDSCVDGTTTTGAPTSTSTTTTARPPCSYPGTSTTTSTTTTSAPTSTTTSTSTTSTTSTTTTTTQAPCHCLYPTTCGTVDGETIRTSCSRGTSVNDTCPTTTTTDTSTTTTTCNCNTTSTYPPGPGPCQVPCEFYKDPVYGWVLISGGTCSAATCPCYAPGPGEGSDCDTVFRPCVVIPPPPPPPPLPCTGNCYYVWIPLSGWRWLGSNCSGGTRGCYCEAPSFNGSDCGERLTLPCVEPLPPGTTTTTVNPCVSCYTTTTTSTTTTSTTTTTTPVPSCCRDQAAFTRSIDIWCYDSGEDVYTLLDTVSVAFELSSEYDADVSTRCRLFKKRVFHACPGGTSGIDFEFTCCYNKTTGLTTLLYVGLSTSGIGCGTTGVVGMSGPPWTVLCAYNYADDPTDCTQDTPSPPCGVILAYPPSLACPCCNPTTTTTTAAPTTTTTTSTTTTSTTTTTAPPCGTCTFTGFGTSSPIDWAPTSTNCTGGCNCGDAFTYLGRPPNFIGETVIVPCV